MLFEDDEDAVDVNVLCICDCHSGTARARRAALPPTLLLGLPMPSLLPPSSPFVRLSKFSMFIQFTLLPPRRGRVGRGEDVPARHTTRRLSRIPPVRQERGQRSGQRHRDASIRQTLQSLASPNEAHRVAFRDRTGQVCDCSARWGEIVAGRAE